MEKIDDLYKLLLSIFIPGIQVPRDDHSLSFLCRVVEFLDGPVCCEAVVAAVPCSVSLLGCPEEVREVLHHPAVVAPGWQGSSLAYRTGRLVYPVYPAAGAPLAAREGP